MHNKRGIFKIKIALIYQWADLNFDVLVLIFDCQLVEKCFDNFQEPDMINATLDNGRSFGQIIIICVSLFLAFQAIIKVQNMLNQERVKIKLMQNETDRWSIFGKDEILVKLWFKGLNYHNFHIFYHFYQYFAFTKKYSTDLPHLHQFNLYVLLVRGKQIGDD